MPDLYNGADHFANSRRRLEDLPSDGGATVDALAGALLRTFVRIEKLAAALVLTEFEVLGSAFGQPKTSWH
jgi:hypothetical protein